jgi:cytochrome c2/polyisoprenoid-binding protein YceI
MKPIFTYAAALVLGLGLASAAQAGGHSPSWTLDGASSTVAFGSIKKDTVGEAHSFQSLSGTVMGDGTVAISIDLASVETNIDIRNERMIEHVFKGAASADLTAQIDMDEVENLGVGDTTLVDAEGMLAFLGAEIEIEAELFVARIAENKVMVTTNSMLFLSTADAGIEAGIDTLMALAKLPGITRTSPITLRLIFTADEQKAEVAPAAPAPATVLTLMGDPKAGKRVFKKCRACHQVKEGRNGAGPSLYNIFGAPAGQVAGFGYSEALAGFLADPKTYLPGNKMAFRGLTKAAEIDNIIAYLAEISGQ